MSELMLTQEAGTMFHLKLTPVPRGVAPTADKLFLVPSHPYGKPAATGWERLLRGSAS
jgi:hypothetical protein